MKPDRRVLFAVLLAMASGLTACDRADHGGSLTGPAAPQFKVDARTIKVLNHKAPLTQDYTWTTVSPVGPKGGALDIGKHLLLIPRGAVSAPTSFSATVRAGEEVRVDLRAWDANGVPVTRFAKPVKLVVDLSDVDLEDAGITDLTKIVVVYHNPNGTLEIMPTTVDARSSKVTAYLDHFSDYSPGWSRTEPEL